MSCGRIALRELGIEPEHYYASEIDKFAISQTRLNFPDTIHLGDVTKWREWEIDWGNDRSHTGRKSLPRILFRRQTTGFR